MDTRTILDISESEDGNIVTCGAYEDFSGDRQGGYLAKFHRETGQLIWERVFQDWTDEVAKVRHGVPANDAFWKIIKKKDDWVLVGDRFRQTGFNEPFTQDLVVAVVDQDGCLSTDCGGFEQTMIQSSYDIAEIMN